MEGYFSVYMYVMLGKREERNKLGCPKLNYTSFRAAL